MLHCWLSVGLTVNCWSLDSAVSFMVLLYRSQPRAAAGTRDHRPRCAAHRTAAGRSTVQELLLLDVSSRSGPPNFSFHSSGGLEETTCCNSPLPQFPFLLLSSTSSPVTVFSPACRRLVPVCLACDCVTSVFSPCSSSPASSSPGRPASRGRCRAQVAEGCATRHQASGC